MNTLIASSLITSSLSAELCWTPEAQIQVKEIIDVQPSPDHSKALFVSSEPCLTGDKGHSITKIYQASITNEMASEPVCLAEPLASMPRWSPDGKWIAFLSERGETNILSLVHVDGGDTIPLIQERYKVETFAWSPDSKSIAFVMCDETAREKQSQKTSLAYVYGEPKMVKRLWMLNVFSSDVKALPLTTDEYCVRGSGDFGTTNAEFDWSPDGRKITFAHSPDAGLDAYHLDSSIATIDLSTGKITPWEKHAVYESMPRYSPDGLSIAYLTSSSAQRYSLDRNIAVRNQDGQNLRLLAPTHNEGVNIYGPNLLGWSGDGKHLVMFEPKGTRYHLTLIPADGSPAKEVIDHGIFFKTPALSHDKTHLGCVVQSPDTPPEAYVIPLDTFTPIQISAVNNHCLNYTKVHTEKITWKSSDGMEIEGLVTYPTNYKPGNKYPLILFVHGGPMGFFDETFTGGSSFYPIASFAEAGFLVLRPNPRGSTGYGKAFRCANYNDWGGGDFIDLMTGIDALIDSGIADPDRLGVMGWSYGGYMTSWIVSHTSRFKAASIGAGPCNLVSMHGTSDLHHIISDYLGEVECSHDRFEELSPLNHVSQIEIPCLIQHGTSDERVPVSQSFELYHAMQRQGKNSTLILYPEMGHRISDPKMVLDSMQRNLAWFQTHLLK